MKIALIYHGTLPVLGYGGIERVVVSLGNELQNIGHEVFLLCSKGSRLKNFEVGYFPENEPTNILDLLPNDIDFLHFHEPIIRKPLKPYLVTIHGNAKPGEHFFSNTCFVSRSHALNHNSRIHVLQGIETQRYPFTAHKSDYYVFMALTSRWVKNISTAVAWAKKLNVKLEIIGGSGSSNGKIKYHGILGDHQGRLEILSGAKALLYPTNWHEPCALAPLEAMACGTPVIGSINGAMGETVTPQTGILCNNYEEMLQAHTKIEHISPNQCRHHVESQFSARRMALDYSKIYAKILNDGDLNQQPRYRLGVEPIKYVLSPSLYSKAAAYYRSYLEKRGAMLSVSCSNE